VRPNENAAHYLLARRSMLARRAPKPVFPAIDRDDRFNRRATCRPQPKAVERMRRTMSSPNVTD
jgi:hypothetical protein